MHDEHLIEIVTDAIRRAGFPSYIKMEHISDEYTQRIREQAIAAIEAVREYTKEAMQ